MWQIGREMAGKQVRIIIYATTLCILWCMVVTPHFGPPGDQWPDVNGKVVELWVIGCIPIAAVALLWIKISRKK